MQKREKKLRFPFPYKSSERIVKIIHGTLSIPEPLYFKWLKSGTIISMYTFWGGYKR